MAKVECFASILSLLAALLISSPTLADNAIVGVNVVHPELLNAAQREETIDSLKKNGVRFIRVGLINDSSLDFVCDAFASGIKTDLIVHPEYAPDAYYHLSGADANALRTVFSRRLSRLDKAGVVLAVIEFANEINHPDFNKDFDPSGRGVIFGLEDLLKDPEAKRVALGFDAYIESLKVLKEIRNHSTVNAGTPIISAGLADVGMPGPHPGSKRDSVSVPATIEYMRHKGLDHLVDGYGVHFYPGRATSAAQLIDELNQTAFKKCNPSKPGWVTEWAMSNPSINSPENENERAKEVAIVKNAFQAMEREARLAAIFYYPWAPEPQSHTWNSAVYRDGGLTKTGRVALSPMP